MKTPVRFSALPLFRFLVLSSFCLLSLGFTPAQAQQSPPLNFALSLGTNVTIRSVALDGSGNVYVTGDFFGTADFDPSANSANRSPVGSIDVFVAKYSSSGVYQWANAIGSANFDYGYGIAVRDPDDVYVGGLTDGAADADPGPATSPVEGGFLVRYAPLPTGITTATLSATRFCAGASLSVPFSITGSSNAGNVFTAQLSSNTGSFATPTPIGSLVSTSAGTITATLPLTTAGGSGYRIRVVSSDPATTGSDNGTDLTVDNIAPTNPTLSGGVLTCAQPSLTLTAQATNATGFTLLNTNATSPNGRFTVTQPTTYTALLSTPGGCTAQAQTTVTQDITLPPAQLTPSTQALCVNTSLTLFAPAGGANYRFVGPGLAQQGPSSQATVTTAGTYNLTVTAPNGCTATTSLTLTLVPSPTVFITLPNGSTVSVAGNLPTLTLPPSGPFVLQASGGSAYERLLIVDRINGYEIRQKDSNTTGTFLITRPGLFTLTVTGTNGCSRTVQGVVERL